LSRSHVRFELMNQQQSGLWESGNPAVFAGFPSAAAPGYKRAACLRRPHLKATIELGDVVFSEKSIGLFQSADPMQPQLLWQPPLPGAKVTFTAPAGLRRVGWNHLYSQLA